VIQDSAARLACFDKAAATAPTRADLSFAAVKQAMNSQYARYFAHHNTTLIGSKTVDGHKLFFIRVPDTDNPNLQITASCLGLDAGGWMCTLRPNYGNFGALPLPIKAKAGS
jgi:hypothetical protein